jgi:hypothetical protein
MSHNYEDSSFGSGADNNGLSRPWNLTMEEAMVLAENYLLIPPD